MTRPNSYAFRWISSYMGCVEYEVHGDGDSYRVEVRHTASRYERSIYNGSEAEWQRDVVAAIGVVRRRGSVDRPIRQEVVAAFNAWRKAEHDECLRRIRSQPERYGDLAEDDPILAPPLMVRGAHYVVGTGWAVEDLATAA